MKPLAGDASFRRYFRLHSNGSSRIVMDSSRDREALAPFIDIAHALSSNGLYTPAIHAVDYERGFALLEDLGDNLLLGALSNDNADALYSLAIKTLVQIQTTSVTHPLLPDFDKPFMLGELNVFREWFLGAWLDMRLDTNEIQLLNESFDWLSSQVATQPLVFIHRDYHSRNLILTDKTLSVIDFQDAMRGPITYDLVSLLKDCYIQWPAEKVSQWLNCFYQTLPATTRGSLAEFTRAFDLCGLQRHLKVLGVFCRLHLRDNKSGYLRDLPLTFHYTMACLESYEELKPFYQFMQQKVQPLFFKKNNL